MDEKTLALIEKIADKLGTSAEHIWNVLLIQAPISGTIDLITCITLVIVAIKSTRFVVRKTTREKTDDNYYSHAEWEYEQSVAAWLLLIVYVFIVFIMVISSITNIISAFFNPEYWVLTHLLGK